MSRTFSSPTLFLFFAVSLAVNAQPAPSADAADILLIRKLEEERLAAGVRKDTKAISQATADDYMQIDSDGKVLDRTAALARIKSSYAQLQNNPVTDVVVRVYGDTAVLSGLSHPQGTIGGKVSGPIRYTRVYVRRANQWRVVHFQQTRVAEAP